jgi:putative acetyltransferase
MDMDFIFKQNFKNEFYMEIVIKKFKTEFRDEVINTWEQSVRATHHFLTSSDIGFYKALVEKIDFHSFEVYCVFDGSNQMIGIFGMEGTSLEMLFLKPAYIGKGVGSQIMAFAFKNYQVATVDVNEDNTIALEFYMKFGFTRYDRLPINDQGKPHPILRLRLQGTVF